MGTNDTILCVCFLQHFQDTHGNQDAAHARHGCKDDTLRDNLRENGARGSSYGTADTYLCGTLTHGDHHNVRHTDGTGQKGSQSYKPYQEVHALEKVVEQLEEDFRIEDRNGLFVRRIYQMGSGNGCTDTVRELTHHHPWSSCHGYHIHRISTVVGLLHQCQWQYDGGSFFCSEIDSTTHIVVHAHYLIIDRVYADALTAGIFTVGEKVLVGFLSDDAHLTVLCNVHIIQIASIVYLRRIHFRIFRRRAVHGNGGFLVTIVSRTAIGKKHGGNNFQLGHSLTQPVHILIDHLPLPSLAESLIGFCGLLTPYHTGIGGKSFKVVVQLLLQSFTAANQCHEHKHAPKDAEPRKERPTLVARQRVKNFAICIYVKSHSALKASMGRMRAAFSDGMRPAKVPAMTITIVASIHTSIPTVGSTNIVVWKSPVSMTS